MIRDVFSFPCWPAKQEKPAGGWPAEPPPTIKSVQYLCEEGDRQRDLREIKNYPLIIFILPFYTHVCHMPILPLSSTKLCADA
jgi:hypothetical protein